ncbi:non-homologous end joining protein Ku [Streptomyces sp. NBC_01361]|uniref:non-homologous end joining protein Ku n=1 Tax=Streptomyces sp. NBC_01361 TaxID=2903838 RepID=UPI002E2FE72C|nr:Ku protein [Streptomyces sp. NBC_01361]
MPVPIWSGYISFGLVSVPTRVYPTVEPPAAPLHLIHTRDGGRIRIRKVCELDEKQVSAQEITRGYDTPHGTVTVTDADLDGLPLPTARAIELIGVLPAERIEPLQIGQASYYLGTDGSPAAAKPYVLLREALARRDSVAIVKYAFRDRERLGMLRAQGATLVLHGLRWSDEIRDPGAGLAPSRSPKVGEEELQAALDLADALSVDAFDQIPDLTDRYRQELLNLIEDKTQGRAPGPSAEPAPVTPAVDLMAALKASAERARRARAGREAEADAVAQALPKKKAPSKKKAAAKKTSGTRVPAKRVVRRTRKGD